MLWLKECPYIDQGQIRPLATANNNVVLMCDECSTVWCQPENVEIETSVVPKPPDWEACGDHLTPGTTRWADVDDLRRVGWDKFEWKDDRMNPADWKREE
jgi:hypothetical protein